MPKKSIQSGRGLKARASGSGVAKTARTSTKKRPASASSRPGPRTADSQGAGTPSTGARAGRASGHIEIIARGVLVARGRVLLCRSVRHDYLYLPGGHVEFSESAHSALRREFVEESGLDIRVGPLLLVSEGTFHTKKRSHHELNLVFHVERAGGKDQAWGAIKSLEPEIAFDWVELAAIPDMDVRPLSVKAFLAAGGGQGGGQSSLGGVAGAEWVSEGF